MEFDGHLKIAAVFIVVVAISAAVVIWMRRGLEADEYDRQQLCRLIKEHRDRASVRDLQFYENRCRP